MEIESTVIDDFQLGRSKKFAGDSIFHNIQIAVSFGHRDKSSVEVDFALGQL